MRKRSKRDIYGSLDKVFHEPSRLAIVSSLCQSKRGVMFNELKEWCKLTDGNLSRHLKTLEEAEVVLITKENGSPRTLTIVEMTQYGRAGFVAYLGALEEVLSTAAKALSREERTASVTAFWSRGLEIEQ
ncbi:MAG: transcriptional regulator [Verrucomicrobia bacterium]|nr:transcriptional regulator [Verrucomicrobiota bacterium]